MKRKWTGIRVLLLVCAAMGWWGFFYPELTLTPDTYAIVDENGTVQEEYEMIEWDFSGDMYRTLLGGGSDKIRFKSKLFTQTDILIEYFK